LSDAAAVKAARGRRFAFELPRLSLRAPRELTIRLDGHGLQLQLRSPGKSGKVLASLEHPITGGDTDLIKAVEQLPAALAMLQADLGARKLGTLNDSCAVITVDDAWMYYDVLRTNLMTLPPSSAETLVSAALSDVAGCEPAHLDSRWQGRNNVTNTFVCAMPSAVMPLLTQILRERGIHPGSVQGDLVRAFNSQRTRIDPACSVVANVRQGSSQLLALVDGAMVASTYEFGLTDLPTLEQRGRGLLLGVGVKADREVRFYVLSPAEFPASHPWTCLATPA
jgi:hypothetical protein